MNGGVVELACEIPECDIDGTHPHFVVLAHCSFYVVVDEFSLEWVFAQKVVGEHVEFGEARGVASDVFTGDTFVGVDFHGVGVAVLLAAFFVDEVESVVVLADIVHGEREFVDFDFGDSEVGHFFGFRWPRS